MPRYELTQRRKAQKDMHRRWDLPAGSHVWCYLRHSPGDNQTIDSQKSGMIEWCASNGWVVERFFIDEAIEGSREDREQFQLMISLAHRDERAVDGIAVWSFSRFARSQLDAQFYKADLRKRGYVIVSKVDEIPNNEMAPLIEAFIDWKNQQFLEDLSADVRRGLTHRVEQGYWPGGHTPRGYRVEKVEIGRRRNGETHYGNHLVKDEAYAERVALAWRMKLETNASFLTIHEATHIYSDPKHYSTFFDNLIYAGIFVYHSKRFPATWEQGATFCEPYITLDDFLKVQAGRQRRDPSVTPPRIMASTYLLTGLVHCGVCADRGEDARLVGQTDGRKIDTRYYRCSRKQKFRGSACTLPIIPCWRVDEVVVAVLKETVLTTEYVLAEVEKANKLLSDTSVDGHNQMPEAERHAKEIQKKVETIVALMTKKGMTAILEAQYDEANRQWLEATARVASLKAQSTQSAIQQITPDQAQRYLDDMLLTLDHGTIEERKAFMGHFIERVQVYPDHVEITLKFRLDGVPLKYQRHIEGIQKEDSTFRSPGPVFSRCPHSGKSQRPVIRSLAASRLSAGPNDIMPALIVIPLSVHIVPMADVNVVMIAGAIPLENRSRNQTAT